MYTEILKVRLCNPQKNNKKNLCKIQKQNKQTKKKQTQTQILDVKFMTVQLGIDWICLACLEGLPGNSLSSLKSPWKLWRNPKTSGTMFSGWWTLNTVYQQKHLILTVRHGSGRMMIWAFFAATGLTHFAVIYSTINSFIYQSVLDSNVR